MMKDSSSKYDFYTPLPEHTIVDVYPIPTASRAHIVTVQHLKTKETCEIEVSFCAILIGSRPDLRFLSGIEMVCETPRCEEIISMNDALLAQDIDLPTLISKKFLWLKNLCAKCKHISICDKPVKRVSREFEEKPKCDTNGTIKRTLMTQKSEIDDKKKQHRSFGLGEDPTKPVDCKNNPIAVDKYSYEVAKVHRNLFAMGPLAGDNFVRFIPGGALAITGALHKQSSMESR